MATYPATESGAICQFPIERERTWRMIESVSGGGFQARRTGRGRVVTWHLGYQNLTDAEALALEQFYAEHGGGFRTFTFADPLANALLDSDDPSSAAWQGSGANVSRTGAIWEGHSVLSLPPGVTLEQAIEVAGGIPYCASAWVRSQSPGVFEIDLAGNAVTWGATTRWRRCWASMAPAGTDGVVPVRFRCLNGAEAEVAALSVMTGAFPGEGCASRNGKGLYRSARFAEGGLRMTSEGPNRNTVQATIEATIEDEP